MARRAKLTRVLFCVVSGIILISLFLVLMTDHKNSTSVFKTIGEYGVLPGMLIVLNIPIKTSSHFLNISLIAVALMLDVAIYSAFVWGVLWVFDSIKHDLASRRDI